MFNKEKCKRGRILELQFVLKKCVQKAGKSSDDHSSSGAYPGAYSGSTNRYPKALKVKPREESIIEEAEPSARC